MPESLTSVEADVIRVLAESRVTASAVTLAADLWRTTPDWKMFDCEPLIVYVLGGLSERGLVRYFLPPSANGPGQGGVGDDTQPSMPRYHGPVSIRLTNKGWEAAGYPTTTGEIGSLERHHTIPGRAGDYTDYRNHQRWASGGPIEREDIWTHMDRYPHHIHDLSGDDMPNNTGTRIKVTPDIEARALAGRTALGPTASMREISERVGLSERMVRYVLTDLPRMRRLEDSEDTMKGSLKERITWALQDIPEYRDVQELRNILGRADSDHDVVHVLHSLHTQGLVDFTEGRDSKEPQHIHLTARGRGAGLKPKTNGVAPETRSEQAREVVPEVEQTVATILPSQFKPDPAASATYPLLDALLDRERKRQEQDNAGMAYVTAAEAIEAIDPDAAKMLMAKAEALNVAFPSPIEQEYLLYVANHS